MWVALALALAVPSSAHAFCGFYVSGADGALYNDATLVVLMREGNQTVLSMQNDYRGPPEDFALVVPVPTVLQQENVRTLPRDVFARIERLSAPRLVEYWEQDPCNQTIGLSALGTIGHGSGTGRGYSVGAGGGLVTVEARFEVGEYDIVILGARDSAALETWLRDNRYRIPEGAAAVLRPYVEASTKFFVARVNVERVQFQNGRAVLSPLRVHYTSDELALPIRLGLLNSSGSQDLIVHVLARNMRYEVANRPNVTIPTNLDVTAAARERFGEVYAALFDRTVAEHPGAVVTEYAWQATSCDPCPPEAVLRDEDLATLGADVTLGPQAPAAMMSNVRVAMPTVRGALPPEVVSRVVRRNIGQLRFCHEQALVAQPTTAGDLTVALTLDAAGAVTVARTERSTVGSEAVEACVLQAARRWMFPSPTDGGTAQVSIPLTLSATRGGRPSAAFEQFVVTRLHYRYGREGLDSDLVFRAAPAIQGGREWRGADRQLEQGATPAPVNSFQARYAIRHPWTGPIECESPTRGIWGGPPNGDAPRPQPATGLATAPRGAIQLASFMAGGSGTGGGAAPSAEPPAPAAEPSPAPSEPASPTPPAGPAAPQASSSGCAVSSRRRAVEGPLLVLALALLAWRRKRG
jgi:TonB family protein